jgi:hypothetical protein
MTKDIDFVVKKDRDNVLRLAAALSDLAILMPPEAVDQFEALEDGMVTIGAPPNRVDFLNKLKGVDFERAWANRVQGVVGECTVNFISKDDYIASKRAAGRPGDLRDIDMLEAYGS